MRKYKIKAVQSTVDMHPNLTSFEREIAFKTERGIITQQTYFEALKREFEYKPKNN